jgi:hypothetical protein
MLAQETSPVLEASVVGMTYGACYMPSYLPAGIPAVSRARRQEDRLHLEGWLCQQLAGDSTVEGRSWAMKTRAHQRLFRRKWAGPDKSDRGQGRKCRTPRPSPTNQRPITLPHDRIQGKREGICLPDAGPRGKVLYKAKLSEQGEAITLRMRRRGAGSRPNRYPTYNQAPAYIRGPGPLV